MRREGSRDGVVFWFLLCSGTYADEAFDLPPLNVALALSVAAQGNSYPKTLHDLAWMCAWTALEPSRSVRKLTVVLSYGSDPGKKGKYRVLGLLGRGGMGAVYKAEDVSIGRLVAIKVLLTSFDNDDMLKRFFSEARANGKLQHPNIVTLYDLGDMDGSQSQSPMCPRSFER